jgi:hypothetical protein
VESTFVRLLGKEEEVLHKHHNTFQRIKQQPTKKSHFARFTFFFSHYVLSKQPVNKMMNKKLQ